jgi:hypothetical protein
MAKRQEVEPTMDELNETMAGSEQSADDDFDIPECDDAVEPHAVEGGEYKLRITGWVAGRASNGDNYLMPKLEIVEPEVVGSMMLTYYMAIPSSETMDEKSLNNAKLKIKRFKTAFKVEGLTKSEREGMIGSEAWALITKKEEVVKEGKGTFGDTDGFINNIQRWI